MNAGTIGTGGHIDHGKTALVAALTGVDTDRLPEERDRGISIDLGFARLRAGDREFGVVDVPGHEAFIRNMLAGASGIDLLLLVVAADEGVMPQTREHVAIAQLLGIPDAIVALTKVDLVDDDWLALVTDDTAAFLADTAFADAPMVPVSCRTGAGIEDLRERIAGIDPQRRDPDDLFRMPIDRCFTIHGTGTVVTGTVWSGRLRADEPVRVLPDGTGARVRGLQVHGEAVDAVEAGQRAAVALGGVDRHALRRGDILVTDPAWSPAHVLTTRLHVLPESEWVIQQRQRVRVHLGTAEVLARVRLAAPADLQPGQHAYARLALESPLAARAGDRFVVRSYSPVTTIAGGRVVEAAARRRRPSLAVLEERFQAVVAGDAAAAVASVLREAGAAGAPIRSLPIACGAPPHRLEPVLDDPAILAYGGHAFPAATLSALELHLTDAIDAYHDARPLSDGIDLQELRRSVPSDTHTDLVEAALRRLTDSGLLAVRDGRIGRADHRPVLTPRQDALHSRIVAAVQSRSDTPLPLQELRDSLDDPADLEDLVRLLEADGTLVRLPPDSLLMHRESLERLAAHVGTRMAGRTGLGPADFRDVLPLSRKFLIPVLEHLDRAGVTVRSADGRSVPAPDRA